LSPARQGHGEQGVLPFTGAFRGPDPQKLAAEPDRSVFVIANAGSGKTKTLIDRVARLLRARVDPDKILCVTYTKAAAAEMQRRLFEKLSGWSIAEGAPLREALADLEGRTPASYDEAELSEARGLFAKALETPGGLKIQTIHAFCEKLLRRFPLEAGISPAFRVMDDAASAAVGEAARRAVARHAMAGEGAVAEAYARMSVALDFMRFEAMFGAFEARRSALADFLAAPGGLGGAIAWAWRACGFQDGEADPEALAAEAMTELDRGLLRLAADVLTSGGTDAKLAERLLELAASPEPAFDAWTGLYFTAQGEPATWIAGRRSLRAQPALQQRLLDDQARAGEVLEQIRAAQVAWDTAYALTLAEAYLAAYRIEKAQVRALDFTDLIEKASALLTRQGAAAWVLYKLDEGVDHILLDEAQDTAPEQWTIIDALTEEFYAGAGARTDAGPRRLFVVGDQKQSIYSFQGARPGLMLEKLSAHRARGAEAGQTVTRVDLLTSWRSAPDVLRFVDAVFAPEALAQAIQSTAADEKVRHKAGLDHLTGCVDVWPLEWEEKAPEPEAWTAPLDAEPAQSANRRLAEKIALEIEALVTRGDRVWDKARNDGEGDWRAAGYGDVLILVRRRRALFEEILRALKHKKIPVAGADRLALSEHIVFDDLLALARFALFPEDDLNLAALLRSPFCDVEDESLFDLAHGRAGEPLWRTLQRRAGEDAGWGEAHELLLAVMAESRGQRPFEFYARLLGRKDWAGRSLRQRLLARLGAEALDALDEFVSQVLAAEQRGVHDLERLAHDFASLSIEVKREMEAPHGEVRVMTAHGAKGLEAPIVFLPETTLARMGGGSPLMETAPIHGLGGFLWCSSAKRDCAASAAARERRNELEKAEAYRLLYVALTRARDRLVLCGRVAANAREEALEGWWGAVAGALAQADIAPAVREVQGEGFRFRRFGPDPEPAGRETAEATPPSSLPAWSAQAAAPEALARYASPSDLGEGAAIAAPSPLAAQGGLGRFRRGELIHRLLQLLPDLSETDRAAGAAALLARERELAEAQAAEMTAAALAVLADQQFAEVFGPGSRAEVAIAGAAAALPAGLTVSGRIDRLVVLADRVLVADFKTNRPAPARIEDADPAYLRQMAIYWAVLSEVFPNRRIEAALVWTDGPRLMPIPENLILQSLAGLAGAS
jgi:ATP-dependent helicase/nuclease subunit A